MQEKTEVALIARIFLCYYYYYFFYTQTSLFLPFPAVVLLCKAGNSHTRKKKFGIMSKSVSMQAASLSQNP